MNNRIDRSAAYLMIIIITLFFISGAYAQSQNKGEQNYQISNDSIVAQQIMKSFSKNLFYGIYDWVTVDSKNGIVTLKGWVHLPWLITQLQKAAEKVPGVKSIDNKIEKTFGPGRIGVQVAHVIYHSDPLYYGQANTVNPPVHIIVNVKTVILEGRVDSERLKDKVTNLVFSLTDVVDVKNELKVMSKGK